MPNVVIIGGGLSGLAAAYELEQQHIPYTLIEVKNRLGGSIVSERRDGFVLDGGVMAIPGSGDWPLLAELGLNDAVYRLQDGESFAFKHGTQALVDALAYKLTGTIMYRMAVSSLGQIEDQFAICLENGLMLTARALIVAAPARHTERMFRSFQPEIGERLFDYTYDTITRVSVGFRREDVQIPPDIPWDMAVAAFHWTDDPSRVPSGHVLFQLGVRIPAKHAAPEMLVKSLREDLGWPTPVVTRVDTWAEADPLTCLMPGHDENMDAIERLLPEGVALVGSDYRACTLEDRVTYGRQAARKIAAWLQAKHP